MNHPPLTVRGVRARAVTVPMRTALGTSTTRMTEAPFVLVDLITEEGITGRAHTFCYLELAAPMIRRIVETAGELIAGEPLEPESVRRACRDHFNLLGVRGVVAAAVSVLDVACWDALSSAARLPLGRYLGGAAQSIPVYNSNGLGVSAGADPGRIAQDADALLARGFNALKIRLGRVDPREDLSAVRAARSAIPAGAALMADYNQALSVEEALERGAALDDEGLYWIEEPVAHDDLTGSSVVANALRTPIQAGENFGGPDVLATAIAMNATDYVMVDLMRIGGVSGWLKAAALAEQAAVPLSSHLYPEVSVHLLAAAATAHWLEYVDWAEPFLAAPLTIADGRAKIPSRPGTGVSWDEDAVGRYAVS